jgi:hypothetical protein
MAHMLMLSETGEPAGQLFADRGKQGHSKRASVSPAALFAPSPDSPALVDSPITSVS